MELLDKLALGGGERVLDIGCGDGKITADISRRVPRGSVLGIDSSTDMVALASRSFPSASHPNLRFREMDAARIDLPPGFDVAFSNATLHWVRDHLAVLRGVRGCLRPGGRILFQMGGRGNARDVAAAVDAATRDGRWSERFRGFVGPHWFYAPDDYASWLPARGFRPDRVELILKDMVHPSPEGLRGWLRTTWFPYARRLPEGEREAFWDAVLVRYLAEFPPDAAGATHVAMVRLEVEAVAE
jgi:trans-aconitate 2-methyltransferase